MGSIDPTTPIIVAGIVVSLIIFCCYTIFTRESIAGEDEDDSPMRPIDAGTSRGLEAILIEMFPTFSYWEVRHLMIGKGALECAVCLNEYEDDETLKLLPKCDHVFHSECIGKWLSSRTTCPVCRDDLGESDAHEQGHVVGDILAVDRGSIAIEVAEGRSVDDGGWIKSTMWSKFPRSHSTGHSLVQPGGENIDRFALKLPDQIRNEIMNRALNRSTSVVVLPRETSSWRECRVPAAGGDGEGKLYRRMGSLDRPDRWMFTMALPMNRLIVLGKNNESLPVCSI